jgi:hypothetical protein
MKVLNANNALQAAHPVSPRISVLSVIVAILWWKMKKESQLANVSHARLKIFAKNASILPTSALCAKMGMSL